MDWLLTVHGKRSAVPAGREGQDCVRAGVPGLLAADVVWQEHFSHW